MKRIDLTGMKFNKLTVLKYNSSVNGVACWECQCECGNIVIVRSGNLKNGHSKSCGCIGMEKLLERSVTHGKSKSPEFWSWWHMQERCYQETNERFPSYGGRGIKVCDRWLGKEGFQNFLDDLGSRPAKGYTLERDNVHGNYEPSNCRWVTNEVQSLNKQNTVRVWYRGELKPLVTACKEANIPYYSIYNGIKYRGFKTRQESFNYYALPKTSLIPHSFGYIT